MCVIFFHEEVVRVHIFQLNPIRSPIMVFLGLSVVLLRTDNKIGHLLCKEIYYFRCTCFMYRCPARLEWVSYGKVESKAVRQFAGVEIAGLDAGRVVEGNAEVKAYYKKFEVIAQTCTAT